MERWRPPRARRSCRLSSRRLARAARHAGPAAACLERGRRGRGEVRKSVETRYSVLRE